MEKKILETEAGQCQKQSNIKSSCHRHQFGPLFISFQQLHCQHCVSGDSVQYITARVCVCLELLQTLRVSCLAMMTSVKGNSLFFLPQLLSSVSRLNMWQLRKSQTFSVFFLFFFCPVTPCVCHLFSSPPFFHFIPL